MLRTYSERLRTRLQELLGAQLDPDRILQEAAVLVDRSDIQEELVRLQTHVKHFLLLLEEKGRGWKETGFPSAEMNREMLSKPARRLAEDPEMEAAIKAEIEKAREQVQNVE